MEITKNNAFFYEVCMLNFLVRIGCLTEKEKVGIMKIAAEDYNATLFLEKSF